jgi:hypothetical protein
LVESLGASWVSLQVHSWVGGKQLGMVVDKGEEGNKGGIHTLVDVGVYHTVETQNEHPHYPIILLIYTFLAYLSLGE